MKKLTLGLILFQGLGVGAVVVPHVDASQTVMFSSRCFAGKQNPVTGVWYREDDVYDISLIVGMLVDDMEKELNVPGFPDVAWTQEPLMAEWVGSDISALYSLVTQFEYPDFYFLLEPVAGGCSVTISVTDQGIGLTNATRVLKMFVLALAKSFGLVQRAVEKDRQATARDEAVKMQAAAKAERAAAKRERRAVNAESTTRYRESVTEHHEYRNAAIAHLSVSISSIHSSGGAHKR